MGRYISQSRGCRGGPVRPSRGQGLKSPEARASVSPEARASSHQRPGPQVTRGQGLKSADPAPARQLPSSRSARGPAVVAPSRGAARGRDSPWVLLAGREAGGCRQPGPSPASAFLIHFLFKRLCRLEIWRDLNELGPISPGHGLAGRRLVSGRPRGWEGVQLKWKPGFHFLSAPLTTPTKSSASSWLLPLAAWSGAGAQARYQGGKIGLGQVLCLARDSTTRCSAAWQGWHRQRPSRGLWALRGYGFGRGCVYGAPTASWRVLGFATWVAAANRRGAGQ